MKKFISARFAGNIFLASLGLLLIFQILVLLGVLPADIVWGGQIQGVQSNLLILETIALLVTVFFMLIVAAKIGYIQAGRLSGAVNIGVWLIFAFLLLNTLGNLASGVSFENLIAAPITIILALCAPRLAVEKQSCPLQHIAFIWLYYGRSSYSTFPQLDELDKDGIHLTTKSSAKYAEAIRNTVGK